MDIGYAFSFPFKDENWIKKLLIFGVITLIPIVGMFVLMGFMADVVRRTLNDDPILMPDLDFGRQLSTGFRLFVVSLIYALPALILMALAYIPPVIGASMKGDNAETIAAIMSFFMLCCMGIMFLYIIFIGFLIPIALVKSILEGTIGAGLKFGEIFAILKAGFLNYLIVLLVTGIGSSILNSIGSAVCGVGVLLTMPYSIAMQGNLMAQAYKVTLTKMAA
jgi:hypothetical protein